MTAQSFLDDTALKTRYVILPFHHCSLLDRLPCRYSTRARRRVDDLLRYAVLPTLSTLAREEPRERVESPTASTRPLLLHYIMFYDDDAPSICYDAAPLTLLRLFYSTSLRYEVERSDTILRRGWPNGAARSPDLVSRGESHPIRIFFKFSRALHPNITRTAVTCSAHLRTLWRRRAHR